MKSARRADMGAIIVISWELDSWLPSDYNVMRSSIPHLRVFVGNWRGFFKDLRLSDTTTLLGILIN